MEGFEEWGYRANPNIDDEVYSGHLFGLLFGRVFGDLSIVIQPETFLMAVEKVWGKRYSFPILYLALAYQHLGMCRRRLGKS